jgi:hypothetical protein
MKKKERPRVEYKENEGSYLLSRTVSQGIYSLGRRVGK